MRRQKARLRIVAKDLKPIRITKNQVETLEAEVETGETKNPVDEGPSMSHRTEDGNPRGRGKSENTQKEAWRDKKMETQKRGPTCTAVTAREAPPPTPRPRLGSHTAATWAAPHPAARGGRGSRLCLLLGGTKKNLQPYLIHQTCHLQNVTYHGVSLTEGV